jgi:hypothetical protein
MRLLYSYVLQVLGNALWRPLTNFLLGEHARLFFVRLVPVDVGKPPHGVGNLIIMLMCFVPLRP